MSLALAWPTRQQLQRHALQVLTLAFLAVAAWFSVRYARTVDWREVGRAIAAMPDRALLASAALAAISHALYACFDLLGRYYTGHSLPVPRVMAINFISYAFNLNVGSLVGGVAFRLRLYSRFGLGVGAITQVMTLSMLTNWLGYFVLAGAMFLFVPLQLPAGWALGTLGFQALGAGLLTLAAVYLGLCLWSRRRWFRIRGFELPLPPPRMAGLQVVMSCANWSVMAGVITVLFQGRLEFSAVLAALLVASLAGVVTHVPAGLGVLEAVFLALLSQRLPQAQILGALLVYRALYYIAPWLLAAAGYLLMETRSRKAGGRPA